MRRSTGENARVSSRGAGRLPVGERSGTLCSQPSRSAFHARRRARRTRGRGQLPTQHSCRGDGPGEVAPTRGSLASLSIAVFRVFLSRRPAARARGGARPARRAGWESGRQAGSRSSCSTCWPSAWRAAGSRGFFAHAFLADEVADSIGWPAGNPFSWRSTFANLALGILGILAMDRRDGFRDATVIAVTIFACGGDDHAPHRHRRDRATLPPATRLRTRPTSSGPLS